MYVKKKRKCPYRRTGCREWFNPKSKIQKSCGNKKCIDANRKKRRKIWGIDVEHRENLRKAAEDWRKYNPKSKKQQNHSYYIKVTKLKRKKRRNRPKT